MEVNISPIPYSKIESRAKANWQRIIDKVSKFSRGITVPGAIIMTDIHLLECYEIKLKLPERNIIVRLHPTKSFSYELLKNFKKISHGTINFNEFLQKKIDNWHQKGKIGKIYHLIDGFKQVEYLPDQMLTLLTPSLGREGELIMPSSILAHWTNKVLEAKRSRETPDDRPQVPTFGEFYHQMNDNKISQISLPETEYIFVLTTDGQLRIAYKALNLFHSSLSKGCPLLSAGKCHVAVVNGLNKITCIEAYSGHYRPSLLELINILEFLENQGVNTNEIRFLIHDKNLAQNTKNWTGNELKIEIKKRMEYLLEELRNISLGAYQLALTHCFSGEGTLKWNHAKLLAFTKRARRDAFQFFEFTCV